LFAINFLITIKKINRD